MSNTSSSGGGIGCISVLFFIFLTLKLTGAGIVGEWSWWWVTAPLWGGAIFVALCLAVALLCSVLEDRQDKRARRRRLGLHK